MLKTTAPMMGPADTGRRMPLAEFEHAEVQEGFLYELSRGVVIVSDVPGGRHFCQVAEIRRQLTVYSHLNPNVISGLGGSGECKIVLADFESERHPDVAVYKTPMPGGENMWADWIPEIVVEVVSPSSIERDYVLKREEYLEFAVREYWIVDAERQEVLALRRRGRLWTERVLTAKDRHTTRSLPGFELDIKAVFRAAARAG